MASLKVKVRVTDPITAVEKAKAKAEADHKRAMAKWEKDQLTVVERQADALYRLADSLISGKKTSLSFINQIPGWPSEGFKPTLYVSKMDRDLAVLRVASDEYLSVSTDSDFASYL